jgi:hypothetical protein
MAAALIPLIAELAPTLINLIVGLVHQKAPVAEQIGPGTGPVKFADVFVSVMTDLAKAKATGQIEVLPDDATVKVIIQAAVTGMQLLGLLGGTAAVSPQASSAQSIGLKTGQSLLITA